MVNVDLVSSSSSLSLFLLSFTETSTEVTPAIDFTKSSFTTQNRRNDNPPEIKESNNDTFQQLPVSSELPAPYHLPAIRTNDTKRVLLMTYMRSGSTWTAAILNQSDSTFYIYEPFFIIVKQGYYKLDRVCFNDNSCRLVCSFLSFCFVLFCLYLRPKQKWCDWSYSTLSRIWQSSYIFSFQTCFLN